jgi:ATPase family associated with various cellular activities (AAA)
MSKTPPAPAKKTAREEEKLNGKVKQVMLTTYKASQKDGQVIQGKMNLTGAHEEMNYIITFNEKGDKLFLQEFGDFFNGEETFDEYGHSIKKLQYHNGKLYSTVLSSYTETSQMLTHEYILADKSFHSITRHTYTASGKPLENTTHHPTPDKLKEKTVFTYDESENLLTMIQTDGDGNIKCTSTNTFNSEGKQVEQKIQYAEGEMYGYSSWTKTRYNKQGDAIETTYLNMDGSVKEIYTQTHKYDSEGKRIVPYHPPYVPPEEQPVPGETETVENDAHGNWVKKITFYKNIPTNIKLREFVYFGENEDVQLIHPSTLVAATEEKEEEIEIDKPEELTIDQAKWLSGQPMQRIDEFSNLRYYALRFKEFPSLMRYSSDTIEVNALQKELTENMHAQEINTIGTAQSGYNEEIDDYTITFPLHPGYLLYVSEIQREDADEYEVPDNIGEKYDDHVYFGSVELFRPSLASGKRDKYFEDSLAEYINKCTVERKPDQPVIHMIEVSGNSFVIQEHDVDDDFEINDLDINYGYGFEKFHDELMERFNNSTKGLVLFHGKPGTGKTYYIRHLLRSMAESNKIVIYMPPNMVDRLVEPAFMTFLVKSVKSYSIQGKFCVLLIEDAEPLLAKRQEGVRIQGVTNLLNMTDGLLNDMLNLQIICTFNVDLSKLDSALLRPGRLIARKEFKPLSELDANLLAQRLGIKHHFKKPATLGQIYAKLKNKGILIHDVKQESDISPD